MTHLFRPPSRDLAVLFLAMSTLLGAGVSMVRSLECSVQLMEPDYPELAQSLRGIARKISEGASFSSAFTAYGRHFSPLHCSLIRTGDQSGDLAEVFSALARREEEWYVTRHRVYTALTYPALMGVLLALMVLVVLPVTVTRMLPLVAGDQPLPWPTAVLLGLCQAMLSWPFWLGVVVLGFLVLRSVSTSSLRESLLLAMHRLPVIGRTLKAAACQAFFYALELQTNAGLNLHSSLRSAADVSGNRVLQESITRQSKRFREGEIELFQVFEAFDPMVAQSVVTLQETGQAHKIFPALARFYQMQVDNTLEKALSLLNPLITVVMGCIIGFVVIATALPIVNLADSL